MKRAARRLSALCLAGGMLSLLGALATAAEPDAFRSGRFDPPRPAPDFSLLGSDGRELKMSGYRGKVVLLAFGYTSCTEVCPITLATLAAARRELGAAAANVQGVYVTVDPERDDPARLREFLRHFDASFVGATGTPQQLAAVRKDYGISAQKIATSDGYAYSHSSFTYLIDRQGRIRSLMPFGRTAADFAHDLRMLLQE